MRWITTSRCFAWWRGRIDLFCRGANEILPEWQSHQGKVAGLTVDRHLALFYPLIHVFYSNAHYVQERERLARGLQLAWQDGSLKRLWRHHFQSSLVFANLGARQIFRLGNPLLLKGVLTIAPTFTIRRRMISVHCPEPGYQVHWL